MMMIWYDVSFNTNISTLCLCFRWEVLCQRMCAGQRLWKTSRSRRGVCVGTSSSSQPSSPTWDISPNTTGFSLWTIHGNRISVSSRWVSSDSFNLFEDKTLKKTLAWRYKQCSCIILRELAEPFFVRIQRPPWSSDFFPLYTRFPSQWPLTWTLWPCWWMMPT